MRVSSLSFAAILAVLLPSIIPSAIKTAHAAAPKLRYGFQADREYPYQIELHAKMKDEKIDREGELIYTVSKADDDQFVVKTKGSAARNFKISSGMGPSMMMGPPMFRPRGPDGITFARNGAVLVSGELNHLPFLLGNLETLVIDEFPKDARSNWESQRDIVIEETESGGGFGGRFGPPIPHRGSTKTTKHSAKEIMRFTVKETNEDTIRIGKTYSLKSGKKDNMVRFDMTGSGEIVFDRKEGVTKSYSMKYELKLNEAGVTYTYPISIASRLLGKSEWEEIKRKRKEKADADKAAAEEAARPKPFDSGEKEKLIRQLASRNDGEVIAAAERLAKAIRDDNPDDVARPLAAQLTNKNAWVQAAIAKALVVWVTPEAEDALVKLLKVDNFMYARPAIKALGKLKTKKAAEAVALQMPRYRGESGNALKEMGPVAEEATIELLKNTGHWMRVETVGVLAEIGGRDALKALKELVEGVPVNRARNVYQAIDKIEARVAAMPEPVDPPPKKKAAADDGAKMRTWRDATGKFEIEAVMVGVKGDKVELKTKQGRTISVSIKKLSDDDKKYIQEQLQAVFN